MMLVSNKVFLMFSNEIIDLRIDLFLIEIRLCNAIVGRMKNALNFVNKPIPSASPAKMRLCVFFVLWYFK